MTDENQDRSRAGSRLENEDSNKKMTDHSRPSINPDMGDDESDSERGSEGTRATRIVSKDTEKD